MPSQGPTALESPLQLPTEAGCKIDSKPSTLQPVPRITPLKDRFQGKGPTFGRFVGKAFWCCVVWLGWAPFGWFQRGTKRKSTILEGALKEDTPFAKGKLQGQHPATRSCRKSSSPRQHRPKHRSHRKGRQSAVSAAD